MRIQIKVESQNGNWKTEDNGRREIASRLPRIETSLASQTHFRKKGKSLVNASRYAQFTRPLPFLRKWIWLARLDRDEERDGKQREIVEKTNTRRLRVSLPVYYASCENACVQLYLTLILLGFVFIDCNFMRVCG